MSSEPTPLPLSEIDLFLNTVEEALDYARAGGIDEGFAALHYGLQRARVIREAWAPELVARYETAVRNFVTEWAPRNGSRAPDP